MGLKEVLVQNNIPLPEDFDERFDVVIAALRQSPDYPEKLQKMKGGKVPTSPGEDWLGPKIVRFLDIITSPAARTFLRGIFAVIFFMSYLEKIPIFGNILSAVLDVMTMGGKMLVKTVQKAIPPTMGLIPLPYMSLFGIVLAALFGYLVWPIIALVSLSRQDFTAAIDSFVRIIPPPVGDAIADVFLEANRTVARLDQKRVALSNDISKAFNAISGLFGDAADNAVALGEKTKEVAKQGVGQVKDILGEPPASLSSLKQKASQGVSAIKEKAPGLKEKASEGISAVKEQIAGKRLSRQTRGRYKWHRRTRRRSVRR